MLLLILLSKFVIFKLIFKIIVFILNYITNSLISFQNQYFYSEKLFCNLIFRIPFLVDWLFYECASTCSTTINFEHHNLGLKTNPL